MSKKTNNKSFKAKILGKEYTVKFQVRNFIALKERFGIDIYDLINKVLQLDYKAIVLMIWCGTLEFDKFDIENPTKIKNEIPLEPLFNMDGEDLRELSVNITQGLLKSLPKAEKEDTKKKTGAIPAIVKRLTKQVKTLLTTIK